ncbi:hypothetical protein WJX72_009592 [[Myrmecia] bisecta]|uniref:CASTOR/POLLUX/SYM8 ion channel conserved domain-containing protein n=1 Tax=[Myrmecia] bisecta TaxID=41462 RepID=A0AAW1PKQ9_9CHLO
MFDLCHNENIEAASSGDEDPDGPRLQRDNSFGEETWMRLQENAINAYLGDGEEAPVGAEELRSQRSSTARQKVKLSNLGQLWTEYFGKLAYRYYNWRQDTSSDLLLFLLINTGLLLLGAAVQGLVADLVEGHEFPGAASEFWKNIYEVLIIVFAQDLPDSAASFAQQVFALIVVTGGLAAFALVLALVEQVVLEVVESNVKRGSRVYEKDHVLVLGWCNNQQDLEVVWKVLAQVCLAYKNDGGRCIVVLTKRDKLQMEATFRRIIPDPQRFGTSFVFRQGSPLVPDDLRMVAASAAAATIVVSDSSRSSRESDAQSLRCAVLLDELDFPGYGVPDPRIGHIIVELKTSSAVQLLTYAASARILGLPTAQLNARRIARMVVHPVVGSISMMLWSFNSKSQAYLESAPGLVGRRWDELLYLYPDGIVFGLVNTASKRVRINPPASDVVEPGDEVLVIRPTSYASGAYRPAAQKKGVSVGDWTPGEYVRRSYDEAPMGKDAVALGYSPRQALSGKANARVRDGSRLEGAQNAGMFMLPLEYRSSENEPERVLICGWGESTFMTMLLRELDHGPAALPRGSELTLFNMRDAQHVMGKARTKADLRNLSMIHVPGNPLEASELNANINLTRYKCAIVLCDESWIDPDLNLDNGIEIGNEADMLRLDAMLMMVQLNLRAQLEASDVHEINIICEKVAFEGVTRFEDRYRLPLGISVNRSAFSATVLAEVAYNPKTLLPYSHLGENNEMTVQDISAFAAMGEELSFWQLQARALLVGQIMYGFYNIPSSTDAPIDIVINPEGDEFRSKRRVWNQGDSRRKVITMAPKREPDEDLSNVPILVAAAAASAAATPRSTGLTLPESANWNAETASWQATAGVSQRGRQRLSFPQLPARPLQYPAQRPCRHPGVCVHASASVPATDANSQPQQGSSSQKWLFGGLAAAAILTGVGATLWKSGYAPVLKDYALNSALGKSCFLAAFALIFLSELGDKTFFIAALLAAKVGKWMSFFGATTALGVMTVISVAIGAAFKRVPEALKSSVPVGEYLGVALMLYFGVRTLKDAWQMPSEGADGGEMRSAQDSIDDYEKEGKMTSKTPWQTFLEVATLIFVAEWGDRSMLATIALGAAQNPVGVALGAVCGHAVATLIAVIGGALASKYISEKTIGYIGGVLFLVFAGATAFGVF